MFRSLTRFEAIVQLMFIDMLPNASRSVNMFLVDDLCCSPILDSVLDPDEAVELASHFKAIADPTRLRLVSIIAASSTGEVCACDLPTLLDKSQPTMSHHLSILVKAGLLEREQRGKWAWFRLRREQLDALRTALG